MNTPLARFGAIAFLVLTLTSRVWAVQINTLDATIVTELSDEQRVAIDEADAAYRAAANEKDGLKKKSAFQLALVKYELFTTRYKASVDEDALCYAYLKQGCCNDALNKRTTAQSLYNIVIENFSPDGIYYVAAIYRLAHSYAAGGNDVKAIELFSAFVDEFATISDTEYSYPSVMWMVDYYLRNGKVQQAEETASILAKLKKKEPRDGNVSRAWQLLWNNAEQKEKWDRLKELGNWAGMEDAAIDEAIFQIRQKHLAAAWDSLQNDLQRQKKLLPKVKEFTDIMQKRISSAASLDAKRGISIFLSNWRFSRRPNTAFIEEALADMKAWMDANKNDGAYMQHFYDIVTKYNPFTFDQINTVYKGYFRNNPKDVARVYEFILLLERLKKNDEAVAELDRISAPNGQYAAHYGRILNWPKAAEYYIKVYEEIENGTGEEMDNAAWAVAGAYQNAGNFTNAIEWYKRAPGKGYTMTNALAVCYQAMGGEKNYRTAISLWQEIYDNTPDKEWKGRSASSICNVAFNLLKEPSVGQKWARRCARDTINTRWPGAMNQLAERYHFDIKGGSEE